MNQNHNFILKATRLLKHNSVKIESEKAIQYGHQFECQLNQSAITIRLFFGKKGPTVDLSQIKNLTIQAQLRAWLAPLKARTTPQSTAQPTTTKSPMAVTYAWPLPLIGVDESGKGDFFGPLVTAAVYVTPDTAQALRNRGVMDSKQLRDSHIAPLADWIQTHCPHTVCSLLPDHYNQRYAQTPNLNSLLASCHIDVIAHMNQLTGCTVALSDQFAKPAVLQTLGTERIPHVTIHQATRAESNIAVAAASIVARARFIADLNQLSTTIGIVLPKGATHIQAAYDCVLKTLGRDRLHTVAKTHFKCAK